MLTRTRARNKTLATWLALLGGTLGLHRFYLRGPGDWVGWLYPIASALGWWGIERLEAHGQDDPLSWVLIPFLGLALSAACLSAIVYGLTERGKWNARYGSDQGGDDPAAPC
jgi:TM2 domain-containing membrane protein YozV